MQMLHQISNTCSPDLGSTFQLAKPSPAEWKAKQADLSGAASSRSSSCWC